MLPASRTIALRASSRTIRAAVEKADAVVQARRGVQFPDGRGLLDKSKGLNAWCKVTVLRLNSCGLGACGGRALAEALRRVEAQCLYLPQRRFRLLMRTRGAETWRRAVVGAPRNATA